MITPIELIKERYKICDTCIHHKYNLCLKCGCVVALKIRIKDTKCPIGNW